MTGWIIFGSIVLFFLIILWQSITVTVDYENKLSVKVKFMFFTLYTTDPKPKKKKKPKKEKKKKKTAEKKAEENSPTENPDSGEQADESVTEKGKKKQKKKKKSITLDDVEMIMDYVRSASPPIKRLFKKIRWYDIYVDWVVATDDAAKTALTYGGICSFLYPFFEWLRTYFTAHVKEINVEANFSEEKSDIFIYFVLKLRLSTALACVIWLGVRLIKTYLKYNNSQPPKKKGK